MIISGVTVLLAPLYFYGLMYTAGLGADGTAYAFIVCQVTTLIGLLGFTAMQSKELHGKPKQTCE